MKAYTQALHLVTWSFVVAILMLATVIAVTQQGSWCPTGTNPQDCVTMDAPMFKGQGM